MVSNDTIVIMEVVILDDIRARVESELEVNTYLQNLRYALQHNARITFQIERLVDQHRNQKYTNLFTITDLFPTEDPVKVLKHELQTLTVEEYIQTVKDLRFPKRSEMREFGKVYNGKGDVYIKIRVELFSDFGNPTAFVMSFHYAQIPFTPDIFPYSKQQGGAKL